MCYIGIHRCCLIYCTFYATKLRARSNGAVRSALFGNSAAIRRPPINNVASSRYLFALLLYAKPDPHSVHSMPSYIRTKGVSVTLRYVPPFLPLLCALFLPSNRVGENLVEPGSLLCYIHEKEIFLPDLLATRSSSPSSWIWLLLLATKKSTKLQKNIGLPIVL